MNYTILKPRKMCNRCSNIQDVDSKHCSACGASFVFGEQDAWKSKTFAQKITHDPFKKDK